MNIGLKEIPGFEITPPICGFPDSIHYRNPVV
jgi:hypothetical protein